MSTRSRSLLLPLLALSLPACLMLRFAEDAVDDTSSSGEPSSTSCDECDAVADACEESSACRAVRAISATCPQDTYFTCVNQGACDALSQPAAAEGLGLWSHFLGCVVERCSDAEGRCDAEDAACDAEPECLALQACTRQACTCIGGDEGSACIHACAQAHPAGEAAWRDLLGCLNPGAAPASVEWSPALRDAP